MPSKKRRRKGEGAGSGAGTQHFKKEGADPFTPHKFDTKVRRTGNALVWLSQQAFSDMYLLSSLATDEISWLGDVEELKDGSFFVKEIFMTEQTCSMSSTEMTEEGLALLAQEILDLRGDEGLEVVNRIRLWGHLHPGFGTTPSGQDETQMDLFKNNDCDWFIRCIANKQGKLQFSVFYYTEGVRIDDVPWQVWNPVNVERREYWEAQIKKKVLKFTSAHSWPNAPGYGGVYNKLTKLTRAPWNANLRDLEAHALQDKFDEDARLVDGVSDVHFLDRDDPSCVDALAE